MALFTNYGIAFRRTGHRGRQYNLDLNPIGYYRAFYPETYEVENGEVSKVGLPGRGYFAPSFSIGTGKVRNKAFVKSRFLKLNMMFLASYNTNVLPLLSIDYGVRF